MKHSILFLVAIVAISLFGAWLTGQNTVYNNPDKFTSEYEVGTDAYLSDSIAYIHPDWSPDKVEDNIFLPKEEFEAKYNKGVK